MIDYGIGGDISYYETQDHLLLHVFFCMSGPFYQLFEFVIPCPDGPQKSRWAHLTDRILKL
jgi:hypothetical protein